MASPELQQVLDAEREKSKNNLRKLMAAMKEQKELQKKSATLEEEVAALQVRRVLRQIHPAPHSRQRHTQRGRLRPRDRERSKESTCGRVPWRTREDRRIRRSACVRHPCPAFISTVCIAWRYMTG